MVVYSHAASHGRVKDTVMSRAPNNDRLSQAKLVCYNSLANLCTALSLLFQYSYSKFCTAFLNHSKSVLFDCMKLGGEKYKKISIKLEILSLVLRPHTGSWWDGRFHASWS